MSKRKPLAIWRGDSPQPSEYDKQRDPLHGDFGGNEIGDSFGKRIVLALKSWMANKGSIACDEAIRSIRLDWIRQGGSVDVFAKIQERAFVSSGYYKMLMKI